MEDEELIEKLNKTIKEGLNPLEYVKDIHLEIPKWLYDEYKKKKIKHSTFYLKGFLSFVIDNKNIITNEQIMKKLKNIEKTLEEETTINHQLTGYKKTKIKKFLAILYEKMEKNRKL